MPTVNVASVVLLFIVLVKAEPLIKNVEDGKSGLYFEDAGRILFFNDEWKIISNINISEYRSAFIDNKNIADVILKNCEELKLIEIAKNSQVYGDEGCGSHLYQLKTLLAEIEESDNNWFRKDTRLKRDVISDLFIDNWSQKEVSFYEQFEEMTARGSKKFTSSAQQTSYISLSLLSVGNFSESTYTFINDRITNQLTDFNSKLLASKNGSFDEFQVLQLKQIIQELISNQMFVLTNIKLKQKEYLNIMPFVGRKNSQIPNIIPVNVLISELNNIRDIISEKGLSLPIKLSSENLFYFYHISSPEIVLFNDQIFIIFQMPLISKHYESHFNLFKVTSSLVNVEKNLFSFIVPDHDFIAVDVKQERYSTLTFEDLKSCYHTHQTNGTASIICKQISPLMPTSSSSECEINILHNAMSQYSCNQRYLLSNAEIFIEVLQPNSWLSTIPRATKVRYICEGRKIDEFSIQENGLLTIDPSCKIATYGMLLTGHNSFPKSSIYEHPISNYSNHYQQFSVDIASKIFSNEEWALKMYVNTIPRVVRLGKNENLLSISYSLRDLNMKVNIGSMKHKLEENIDKSRALLACYVISMGLVAFFIIWMTILLKIKGQI